jgi:hypothetical protein
VKWHRLTARDAEDTATIEALLFLVSGRYNFGFFRGREREERERIVGYARYRKVFFELLA